MSFFYDLNKKLNSIGNEQEQIAKEVAKATNKSPVRKSLEESLRSDMKALMEDGTGGMNFSGSGSLEEKAGYSAKKAAAGKDIGKPGKNFAKIAKGAAERYGSKAAGERVAGAVLNKLRHANEDMTDEGNEFSGALANAKKDHKSEFKVDGKTYPVKEADMDESALQAYLGNKKYGKQGMDALRKAGREHAGKDKMNQIRNRYDKMDETEMECDTPTPSKGIPGNVPVKGKMDRLKGKRDYYENDKADDSDEDIMDYLNRKLAPHDKEQAKENAVSKPYNGSAGDADAYNGMEFEAAAMPPPDVPQAAITAPSPDAKYQVQKPQAPQAKTDWSKVPNDVLQKAVDGGYPDANPALIAAAKTELANRMSGASRFNPTINNKTMDNPTPEQAKLDPRYKTDPKFRQEVDTASQIGTDPNSLRETMTRQHFQHTADLLKHIEDPAKRMELAKHHAGVFKASNPRFDHGKFMKACNCDEGIAGQAAGTIAGGAIGGPVGAAIGGAIGNNLTNEEDFEEGIAGQAVGTLAGGALGGPVGAAIGGAIGNNLTGDGAVEEGYAEMDAWLKQREKEKGTGKFDKRKVSTGTVYTRRFDDEPNDDDTDAPVNKGGNPAVKRGRGRPAGTKGATGSRGPTGKSKLMAKDAIGEENVDEVCHHCGQAIQEKAVSKKQQRFMGMVHAAQKGEKPASKEVAKTAKGMKKKDAEDFASTKHKGLPEKVKSKKTEEGKGDGNLANNAKPYDKVTRGDVIAGRLGKDEEGGKKKVKKEEKVDETTTSGSVATASEAPKSSKGGMKFGGGIYDSWNRQYETLLAENVNVNTTATKNDDGQDHESITITVDGDDVSRFKQLLQSMGITQNHSHNHETHSAEPCSSCGGVPCQCDELDETFNDDLAKLRADAAIGMKKSIDSQSDARMAALKNPPKEKSFMQQVGDKQIGMVKGAWKGLTGQNEELAGEGVLGTLGGAAIGGALGGPVGAAVGAVGGQELTKGGSGIIEADAPVSQNEPDYPTNQEETDDALQYSGGLDGPKSTGQTTIPVVASQEDRLHSMEESVDSFLSLYKAFKTK